MRFITEIKPSAAEILNRFQKFPPAMAKAVMAALDKQNELTVGHIQQRYLSQRGPNTLGVITNRLRLSVNATPAVQVGDKVIESALGSNVIYAGAHEFGVDKTVTVRAHARHGGAGDRFKHGEAAITRLQAHRLGVSLAGKKPIATGLSQVREHSRHMRLPARAPFRHGLQDRLPAYQAALSAAVLQAWQQTRTPGQ